MGTVKYTGPVASFHCPTNADIRSLKVHFSPKQLGEGTPSPDNVREIEGWDGVYSSINKINIADKSNFVLNKSISWGGVKGTYGGFTTTNYHASFLFHIPHGATLTLTCYNSDTYWIDRIIPVKYDSVDWNNKFLGYYNYALYNSVSLRLTTRTWAMPEEADGLLVRFRMVEDIAITQELFNNLKMSCVIGSVAPEVYEPYRGSTTNYTFGVLGKNKFDYTDSNNWRYANTSTNRIKAKPTNVNISISDNVVTLDRNAERWGCSFILGNLIKGASYCISGTFTNIDNKAYIAKLDSESIQDDYTCTRVFTLNFVNNQVTFTPTENGIYELLIWNSGTGSISVSNLQLELGSTATTYEPYNPNHTVYGGWVDLITGEVCEEYRYGGFENLNISAPTSTSTGAWAHRFNLRGNWVDNTIGWSNAVGAFNWYCDRIECVTNASNNYQGYSGSSVLYIYDDTISTVEEFRTKYADAKIAYKMKEAIYEHYTLAPTQLQTFLGQNNVWSNADYVEVEYDLHETQDILARKQFIMASQPHVEEASGAIATFNTDMAAKLKECKVGFKPVQDLHGYSKPWVAGAGKNLFNEKYDGIQDSETLAYYSIYVGDNDITASTTAPWVDGQYANLFVLAGQVISGASSGVNDIANNRARTVTPIDGYITLAYRNYGGVDPRTYKTQIEKGSTATSYEPYENICPIEGWNGIEVNKAQKSLVKFKVEQREASGYYNGYAGWVDEIPANHFPIQTQLVYSVYLNCTNSTNENERRAKIWIYQKQGTYRYAVGNQIEVGSSGVSVATVTIQDTDSIIGFGLGMSKGTIASQPMVELGSTETDYEEYNGETIPITFPVTKNLLDVTSNTTVFNTISTSNGVISCTSTASGNSTNIRFTQEFPTGTYTISLRGRGEGFGGARLLCNTEITGSTWNQYYDAYWIDVYNGGQTDTLKQLTFTLDAASTLGLVFLTKYNYVNQPAEIYDIQIEQGSTATAYEPYRTIYGGYVDLVKGEVVQTWNCIRANERTWSNYSAYQVFYTNKSDRSADSRDISDKLGSYTGYGWANAPDNSIISGNRNNMFIKHLGVSSNAEFKEWLDEVDPIVYYELAEPIHYTLSPSQLKSLRGINNIYSNTNDNITVKYWKH